MIFMTLRRCKHLQIILRLALLQLTVFSRVGTNPQTGVWLQVFCNLEGTVLKLQMSCFTGAMIE